MSAAQDEGLKLVTFEATPVHLDTVEHRAKRDAMIAEATYEAVVRVPTGLGRR